MINRLPENDNKKEEELAKKLKDLAESNELSEVRIKTLEKKVAEM
jgi:hypothetical protein